MHNQRRVKRTQVVKPARIVTADSVTPIACVVLDLTNLGAGLRIPAGGSVPDYFELMFGSRFFSRHCRVRWRHEERLGVEFSLPR